VGRRARRRAPRARGDVDPRDHDQARCTAQRGRGPNDRGRRQPVGIVTRSDLVRAFTRPDDEVAREITHDVVERIFWLDATQVAVTVEHGNVTLAGAVETETDATLLPEIVRRVPGVVSVEATLEARQARV
jgi:CBS domain-containing protein